MTLTTTYSKPKPVMIQLQALALYHTHGMEAVEKTFPQYKDFVQAHKNRPFQEVKQELLHACQTVA